MNLGRAGGGRRDVDRREGLHEHGQVRAEVHAAREGWRHGRQRHGPGATQAGISAGPAGAGSG